MTVKLDADQLRQILAAKVEALSILGDKKASALDTIRKLPAEILNKLVMRLVVRGIEQFPELLLEFLQSVSSGSHGGPPPEIIV